jgi:hypothetical protein
LKIKICSLLIVSVILFISSCSKGGSGTQPPVDPCAGLSFKFGADVQPIFNATCAINSNCHGAGSTNAGGPLTNYNKIFAKRVSINGQVSAGLMPQNSTLSPDQKNKILCWINSGAPNN